MGLFSGIKDNFKKSEAAVCVQNLLEQQQRIGYFTGNPANFANVIVQAAWDDRPDIFSGKFGQRPHKIAVTAVALSRALSVSREGDANRVALLACLGAALSEAHTNAGFYLFNNLDMTLIEAAGEVFIEKGNEMGVPM
ncbi:hypothetical protein U4I36_12850 [Stenotrophomonas maltophilia]|uniref:hypothetical protein n=1 Tax=Stenotrophomonas maltophilia TaxID=40324 RepID=UPI0018D2EA70|nr:hypothetical protein [Stenotrophomonas maltophilia]MBH1417685.1 hypothetical protein [Stenotrophomonas maltophilia]MBH1813588.1 hypothetical protein [Stenotrophomonas maltophilia]MBH1822623.1 hypothetical protein [Stenotrophomonas maltophilia]MDZ5805104.1 hypothetical protein [Stenotrophomonas maltophilia]HEL3634787.1 hypothetical protein [Stenotrophomonas maltophilia]